MMNMADSGWPCQARAGHHCVPHQQRLIHVRVWHGLDWRCLSRRIQRLLRQLLHQSGVAKGQPQNPVAEGSDALLQATCCSVRWAEMPDQPKEGATKTVSGDRVASATEQAAQRWQISPFLVSHNSVAAEYPDST